MTNDSPETRPLVRMTVNLLPRADDAVQRSAKREELSRTDVINRAITFYDGMMEEIHTGGAELLVRRPDGTVHLVYLV